MTAPFQPDEPPEEITCPQGRSTYVAAVQENWEIIKTHIAQMVTIFEVIIREGVEAGEFEVEDPRRQRARSKPRSRRSSIRF